MRPLIVMLLLLLQSVYGIPGVSICTYNIGGGNTCLPEEKKEQLWLNSISASWENDLYYQHDYYYTNGFQVDLFLERLRKSPINRVLIPPGGRKGVHLSSGLQLRQEIYTPKDLASDSIIDGDHPYVSTLTFSLVNISLDPDKGLRMVSRLSLGALGPASLGFLTQRLAHSVSNPSRPPHGWE